MIPRLLEVEHRNSWIRAISLCINHDIFESVTCSNTVAVISNKKGFRLGAEIVGDPTVPNTAAPNHPDRRPAHIAKRGVFRMNHAAVRGKKRISSRTQLTGIHLQWITHINIQGPNTIKKSVPN